MKFVLGAAAAAVLLAASPAFAQASLSPNCTGFDAAPTLPPCGLNANSSRTWVDFYDSTDTRLYGFCALGSPSDLGNIWFAMEEGVVPPSYVYITLTDRQTNTTYKSNLADTVL